MIREDSIEALQVESYIVKAIQGDEEAFTWIYKTYSKKVYFMAVQFFKQESMAEDIVQEVFLQIHKKINTLQSAEAFNAWLHTITYRTCVNHKRGKVVLMQFENERDEEILIEDTNKSASEYLEDQRIQTIIMETLDTMKLPLRVVGQLKFLEEMKNMEIAEVLDISKVTVHNRIKKIRKILQTNLEKNGITSSSYSIVVSPIVLQEAYKVLCNSHIMSEATSNHILSNVLTENIKVVHMKTASQIVKYVLGITVVISSVFFIWQTKQKENSVAMKSQPVEIVPEVKEPAKIVTINHSTQWQQTVVQLDIETTNDNYDTITIDDKETLKISNNGTYIVKLIKEGKVMDQREVTITNIDRNSPKARSEKDDTYYYFYLTDEVSGVDGNSIQYIKNGDYSTEYTYLDNEKLLLIPKDGISTHKLYISDYAGNIFEITIG